MGGSTERKMASSVKAKLLAEKQADCVVHSSLHLRLLKESGYHFLGTATTPNLIQGLGCRRNETMGFAQSN